MTGTTTSATGTWDVPSLVVDLAYIAVGVVIATVLAWPVYASSRMILVAAGAKFS